MIADPFPRTTARLVLRRFAARDLAAFQAYRCDPAVGRYQGWSVQEISRVTQLSRGEVELILELAPKV